MRFLDNRAQREVPLLTIGPMFPERAAIEQIGRNVTIGIRHWADAQLLDPNSPFIQAVLNALGSPNSGLGAQLNQRPQTPYEQMVAQIVHISLKMRIAG